MKLTILAMAAAVVAGLAIAAERAAPPPERAGAHAPRPDPVKALLGQVPHARAR